MSKKPLLFAILIIAGISLLTITACSNQSAAVGGGSSNSNAVIKQTRITAQITGDTVTIPVSDLDTLGNVNFVVNTAQDKLIFMAYKYGNKTYVRANLCVPCRTESFTLNKNTLVCDACGTVFDVQTGKGISGVKACQGYPKQPVVFQITDGNIVMKADDLVNSFQSTLNPKGA